VPPVLLSGHHAEVAAWRREQAERLTRDRRPDLWAARSSADVRSDHSAAPVVSDRARP
jgi:tRNA (guanine37-N1)-methyltransferase